MWGLKALFTVIVLSTISSCDFTPKPERSIKLAKSGAFSATLSENYALIGTTQGYAELWNIKGKPSLIHKWKHTDEESGIIATDISVDENYAVTTEKNSIAWWRISDGILLSVWALNGINTVSISPDGQYALVALEDKAIYLSLAAGQTLFAFDHDGPVTATDISDSGLYAITGGQDKLAKLWELSSGELKHSWKHNNRLSTVSLSKNDKYALTNAALSQTYLWKISSGKQHKKIAPKLMTYSAATFSHNSKYVLLGHTSRRIELWKIKTGKMLHFWRPKKEENWRPTAATILALNFASNNKKFTSFSTNGNFQKWRVKK